MTEDPVRAYLRQRRVSQQVIDGGLEYLVGHWALIADRVESHETWVSEEWDNDMDCRQILDDVFAHVPGLEDAVARVERSDARFLAQAVTTHECVWGDKVAERKGWTSSRNWWYWTRPPTPFE